MFGSIGGPEILLIFVLGLLLFGPRKLPEIGRTIGKTLAEFRRATSEFSASLEREVELEKLKDVRAIADRGGPASPGGSGQTPGPPIAAGPVAREVRSDAAEAATAVPIPPSEQLKPPDA